MSRLPYQLGAQGQQLLNANNQYSNLSNDPKFQVPTALDYLLHDIVNPKSSTTPDKIYSYLAYYYPKLQNTYNVNLLTTHFLKCPIFFNSIESITVEKLTKIIECFQYIIITKFKVSNPTIPFHEFYSFIYDACRLFIQSEPTAYWKVLAILGGCISAIPIMNDYNPYPTHFNVISKLNSLFIDLYSDSLISIMKIELIPILKDPFLISLIYTQEHLSNNFYSSLLKVNPKILSELMKILFFSEYGLNKGLILENNMDHSLIMKNQPVLRQLNKWAFIYGKIVNIAPKDSNSLHIISSSLDYIVELSTNISNNRLELIKNSPDKWNFVKYIFFTIIMIFEHATTFILQSKQNLNQISFLISNQMIRSLFYLSYILDQIGTGGFDAYNFVFDSTTSLLVDFNPEMAQILENSLNNEIKLDTTMKTSISESKIVFFLRTTESLLTSLQSSFKNSILFPMIEKIFSGNSTSTEIEFCHSIMIKYLNTLNYNDFKTNEEYYLHVQNIIFPYFNRVLTQFPTYLSLAQTSLITQTCSKVVSLLSMNEYGILNSLIDSVKFQIGISSLTPLPSRTIRNNGDEIIIPEKLNTKRAGLISLYIDIVQFIPTPMFVNILNDIKKNIDSLNGDKDIYSLYDILWEKLILINKYDCQKGQFGLDWWYDTVNQGLVPKL